MFARKYVENCTIQSRTFDSLAVIMFGTNGRFGEVRMTGFGQAEVKFSQERPFNSRLNERVEFDGGRLSTVSCADEKSFSTASLGIAWTQP